MPSHRVGCVQISTVRLAGKPLILQTDHQFLTFFHDAQIKKDWIMRWTLALQEYDYTA